MTTKAESTALTRDQVETQIRAWFAAGLPTGVIALSPRHNIVYVQMPDPNSVVVWAVALGRQMTIDSGSAPAELWDSVSAGLCAPAPLPGWQLEVWCEQPVVSAELRIALRTAS